METRPLGATGQASSIMAFGGIVLDYLEQPAANQMVEWALDQGINHFDVAPRYGDAELKLGPKLRQHREDIFLGCKTQARDYDGAARMLDRSLNRLGVDQIDLYQFHGLEYEAELEEITGEDGALAAFRDAQDAGKIEHIGLTSHGDPGLIVEAIEAIPELASVMFPLNPVVVAKDDPEYDYERVLDRAEDEDIGTLAIKAFAKGPWPPESALPRADRAYANWYEPVGDAETITERFDFVAAQGVTSVLNPGDPKLVAMVADAATRYDGMDEAAQRTLIEESRHEATPVPEQLHH
ncbi:MAG: aldo/keto reductase [Halobacteriaceae archaeon]